MQFSLETTLAEVRALQRSSEELAKIISIVIPDIASYPPEAVIDDLGPRNAYNAAISLDLILREHLAQRKILYEMTCCTDNFDEQRAVLFCFAPNRNAPWVLVLPAAEQDTVPAAKQ